jgi:hypothetical protein
MNTVTIDLFFMYIEALHSKTYWQRYIMSLQLHINVNNIIGMLEILF